MYSSAFRGYTARVKLIPEVDKDYQDGPPQPGHAIAHGVTRAFLAPSGLPPNTCPRNESINSRVVGVEPRPFDIVS